MEQQNLVHDEEINLLGLLLILARRWRLITNMTILAAFMATGVTMILPERYQAVAKIVTLRRQTILPVSTIVQKNSVIMGATDPLLQQISMPIIKDVLLSDSILESLANEFKFRSAKHLLKYYKVTISKTGNIEIKTEDANPKRAAAIANAAIIALGRVAYELNIVATPKISDEREEEIKNTAGASTIIKLLQSPTPPKEIFSPNRAKIVLLSTVAAFICSISLAFALESLRNLGQGSQGRLREIKAAFGKKSTHENTTI